jgi:hypothetical protein
MSVGSVVLLLVTAAWFVPLLVFLVRSSRAAEASRVERKRILDTGVPATATVRGREVTGPYSNNVGHVELALEVTLPGAPPYAAQARAFFPPIDYARLEVGRTLDVRVDPADRAKVAVVGDRVD